MRNLKCNINFQKGTALQTKAVPIFLLKLIKAVLRVPQK